MNRIIAFLLLCFLSNPLYSQDDAKAYCNRGNSKSNLGDDRGAIEDYTKAIEIDPNSAKAYFNRGLSKLGLGQKDSGCLDLSKAGELGAERAYESIK